MKTTVFLAGCIQMVLLCTAKADLARDPNLPELSVVRQYVQASLELGRKRTDQGPDQERVNAMYAMMLPVIRTIDARYATRYEVEIRQALDNCLADDNVPINEQIVGKGLQHVTVQAIRAELDFMSTAAPADAKASGERIAAYFEHIRPTFARRDKGFFEGKKILEKAADDAVGRLVKSGKDEFLAASRELEDAIARTIALSVLYEIEELEKARDTDIDFCGIKKIEAVYYYRILQSRIERRSPRTNEFILAMLNGSYGAVNSKELERYLVSGLSIPLR